MKNELGSTNIEYCLIVGIISLLFFLSYAIVFEQIALGFSTLAVAMTINL